MGLFGLGLLLFLWPSNDISYLSSFSKQLVMSTTSGEARQPLSPIVPFDRYSSLNKLLAVADRIIEFIVKLGAYKQENMNSSWGTTDFNLGAKLHLLSIMQSQCFVEELAYLKNPENKKVPDRIRDMNLFMVF